MTLATINQLSDSVQQQIKQDMVAPPGKQASGNLLIADPGMGAHATLKDGVSRAAIEHGRAFVDLGDFKGSLQAIDQDAVLFLDINLHDFLAGIEVGMATAKGQQPDGPGVHDLMLDKVSRVREIAKGGEILDVLERMEKATNSVLVLDMKGASNAAMNVALAFVEERKIQGLDMGGTTLFLSQSRNVVEEMPKARLEGLNTFVAPIAVPGLNLQEAILGRRAKQNADAVDPSISRPQGP